MSGKPKQIPFGQRQDVQQFIQDIAKKDNFDAKKLTALFNTVAYRPVIVHSAQHSAKTLPWYQYKQAFINQDHIQLGIQYYKAHKQLLLKAERIYHVPATIIVALVGIESHYGENTGHFKVLNSLANLTFIYNDRTAFFRDQLEQFLLLCREKKIDPQSVMGSYAGAIGQLQFMPAAVRSYAVDFNHDGKIDLSNDTADIIGSIANFLHQKGWVPNTKIAIPATKTATSKLTVTPNTLENTLSIDQLKQSGITPNEPIKQKSNLGLVILQQKDGQDYWIGLDNLYVITHYNTDVKYAMAAKILSEKIQQGLKSN